MTVDELRVYLIEHRPTIRAGMGGLETGDIYSMALQRVEKPLITLVLKKTEGNQVRAAHLLGINRNTLRKKIREPGIRGRSAMMGKRGARKRKSNLGYDRS